MTYRILFCGSLGKRGSNIKLRAGAHSIRAENETTVEEYQLMAEAVMTAF